MMGASAVAIRGSLIRVISRSSNCNSRRRSISVSTRTSSCSNFGHGGFVAEVPEVFRKSFTVTDFQLIPNRNLVVPRCCASSSPQIFPILYRLPPQPQPQSFHPASPRFSSSLSPSTSSSSGHISSFNSSVYFSTFYPPPYFTPSSLMSSRLGPALTSTFSGTRLEALFTSEIRWRHASNLARPSHVKADRLFRCNFHSRSSSWCEGRVGKFMNRAMDSEKRRIECYSTSQAGGSDPPASSSVLPPIKRALKAKGLAIRFCPRCGGATEEKIPAGEHELRFVCTSCGAVHYQNPKMVVGCLVEHEGKVLLCKRSIEPSYGLWTLPAGYMEIGESAAEGAARETREEACADVQVLGPFAHLDIPFIGQSYIIFRARLKEPHFSPGPESLECALFKLNELPFESLAFSSIHVALSMYMEDMKEGKLKVHHGVIDKRPGASPSDLKGFVVRDVLSG